MNYAGYRINHASVMITLLIAIAEWKRKEMI
jgi:hypothetical protein